MNKLILVALLATSTNAMAFTKSEQSCLTKMLYRECRSKTCTKEWSKLVAVTVNRAKVWKKQKFHAKNSSLCAIINSKEFSGRRLYNKPMKETKALTLIKEHLSKPIVLVSNAIFFKTRNGKMVYSGDWRKV
jgi:hypothetical protein